MSRNTKFIILCMVILGIFIDVAVTPVDKKKIDFEEFIADAQMKAAEGDKDAEMLMSGIRMSLGTADESDYESEKLLSYFLPMAEAGDAGAESIVGHAYYMAGDMVKAALWLERSAEQGDSNSYFALAQIYIGGDGVEQNIDKMIKYLEKSAEEGNIDAQSTLATIYNYGEYGVAIDYKKSKRWAEPAAEQGDANAQSILGFLYVDGNGVEVDYGKAQKWLTLAAKQLDVPLLWGEVGALYLNYENHLQGAEQDYKEGYYWLKKATDVGYSGAQGLLGMMYFEGLYVEQNYEKAYRMFKLAAESGNGSFAIYIGWMYEDGLYVKQDYIKALKWYKFGAEHGDIMNIPLIGLLYESGYGVEKNLDIAIEYYKKGAALGNELSKERLSKLSEVVEGLDN